MYAFMHACIYVCMHVCIYVCVCSHTEACQSGRTSLVIIRCDAGAAGGTDKPVQVKVQLPSRCTVGTCDGCNFVFMLSSPAGCHVCTQRDFHTYKTLCVDGRRRIITDMMTYVSLTSLSASFYCCCCC